MSPLQISISKFESLKMTEDEAIAEYSVRVLDIANESYALGQMIFEAKLV